jgi:hypothetical protein
VSRVKYWIYATVADEIIICNKQWGSTDIGGLQMGLKAVLYYLWEAVLGH